jgi:hypothetical protein
MPKLLNVKNEFLNGHRKKLKSLLANSINSLETIDIDLHNALGNIIA